MLNKIIDSDRIKIRTILTPREVSHSCGLALKFDLDDLEIVKDIIENEKVEYDNLFKVVKNKDEKYSEKLI